jgi:hypothetical protein
MKRAKGAVAGKMKCRVLEQFLSDSREEQNHRAGGEHEEERGIQRIVEQLEVRLVSDHGEVQEREGVQKHVLRDVEGDLEQGCLSVHNGVVTVHPVAHSRKVENEQAQRNTQERIVENEADEPRPSFR